MACRLSHLFHPRRNGFALIPALAAVAVLAAPAASASAATPLTGETLAGAVTTTNGGGGGFRNCIQHYVFSANAAFNASGEGSMNIETRIPSRVSSSTNGFKALNRPTTSRPPSVVRSVRFSGTRQQACGRILSAISSIGSVAAISKLSGFEIDALRRTMSSSRMCRMTALAVPTNGHAPVMISYSTTAAEKRSARASRNGSRSAR